MTTENKAMTPEVLDNRHWVTPLVDIYENEDELLLVSDLPGVSDKKLNLNLEKNELTIEGDKECFEKGEALGRECSDYGYRRRFALPSGIDSEKITAELKHGVLTVHLPKSDTLKPRRIAIKAK